MATLTGDDVLCLTFSGLSKAYRVCGYRAGWVAITGPKKDASSYLEGIHLLASMRLCANVPAQHAIQTALGGYQSINELIVPGGRLYEQRTLAHKMLNEIDGISCTSADGALYLFPKIDVERFDITDDEQFALDLLEEPEDSLQPRPRVQLEGPGPLPPGVPARYADPHQRPRAPG